MVNMLDSKFTSFASAASITSIETHSDGQTGSFHSNDYQASKVDLAALLNRVEGKVAETAQLEQVNAYNRDVPSKTPELHG